MINYSKPAIQDLHSKGVNPLKCVICEVKDKRKKKMTCGDKECVSIFFRQRVVPDVSEERILR